MDAYDMADPVNILAKLPADFYDKIVSLYIQSTQFSCQSFEKGPPWYTYWCIKN